MIFLASSLRSQIVLEEGLDFLLLGKGKQYGVLPAGDHGVVLFSEISNYDSDSKKKWEVTKLDTLLKVISKSYFESDYNFMISHVKHYKGYIYLLFQDSNIPMKSAFFVRGNLSNDIYEIFELREFLPDKIIGIEILGNSLFLLGQEDKRPAILKFRYGDPRPLVLKGLSADNTELLNTSYVEDHDMIQIVTRIKKRRGRNSALSIKQFDETGSIRKDILIESTRGRDLLDCKATTDADGNICVVGTFSYGSAKLSNGIFTMVHDGKSEQRAYYYEYTNLHNYFNYLAPKEKDKMTRKYGLEERKSSNSKYKINQIPREIIGTDQGWVYLGEMVKFTEKNSTIYGNIWQMEYRSYSHTLILRIGHDGKLKWDYTLGLDDLTTTSEMQRVHFGVENKRIIFFHLRENIIYYKTVSENESLDNYGSLNLPQDLYDKTGQYVEGGSILPWYENKYIVFGAYQATARNTDHRKIIYLHKVSATPENTTH